MIKERKEEKREEKGRKMRRKKEKRKKKRNKTRAPDIRNWESPRSENEPGPLNKRQGPLS